MSDVDNRSSVLAALTEKIEQKDNSDDKKSEAVSSDAESDKEAKVTDSDTEETEETASDESSGEKMPEEFSEEVKFDFRDTPTSVQNLVTKLSHLSDAERAEKISKITRKSELEAVKKAFPQNFEAERSISKKDFDALSEKLTRLEKLENLEKTAELLARLESAKPQLEETLRNRMLRDMFGNEYKNVLSDTKFTEAYEKYPTLSLEERLEIACTLSPVARAKILEKEVAREVKTRAAKTPAKGKPAEKPKDQKEMSPQEFLTGEGMGKYFGDKLANMEFD